MTTYRELLRKFAREALEKDKEPSAIKRLLLHCSRMGSAQLVASLDECVPKDTERLVTLAVRDYLDKGRPIQHIIGSEHFFGREFLVNKDVLIPRFETEELVEHILYRLDEQFPVEKILRILDVGTGSGCIAITLALEREATRVVATEISDKALAVARKNHRRLGGDVVFRKGHLLEPVKEEIFDVVVANPPYIPQGETLDPLVGDHEPEIALFGGEDGLRFYRRIIEDLKRILAADHLVAFEHGHDQAERIADIIRRHFPKAPITCQKDLAGKERMTFFRSV